MAYQFKFPDVGEGIHEGKIVKWHVKEGDEIKTDAAIAEVETDKAVVEIPSPVSGKILKRNHAEGDIIKVGEILVEISASAEGGQAPSAEQGEAVKEEVRESTGVVGALEATAAGVMKAPILGASGAVFGQQGGANEVSGAPVPPKTENGLSKPENQPESLHVQTSNTETTEVKSATATAPTTPSASSSPTTASTPAPAASPAPTTSPTPPSGGVNVIKAGLKAVKKYDMFGYVDRLPYDSVRKAVGDHMVKSFTTAVHVTHTDLADVTDLVKLREKEKARIAKQAATSKSTGAVSATKPVKLTFLPYFIKAVIAGLIKHPTLNAELDEANGQILLKKYYNIGIAVDTQAGLMVPVIKGADKKSILDLAKEIEELAEKARSRKLNPMDMKGGTFTLTNIGSAGSGWFATPIINFPQAAILGTGMIQDMVVAYASKTAKTPPKATVRKMLPLSTTFDHRILDGAQAALFTKTVKEHLEKPALLLAPGDKKAQSMSSNQ